MLLEYLSIQESIYKYLLHLCFTLYFFMIFRFFIFYFYLFIYLFSKSLHDITFIILEIIYRTVHYIPCANKHRNYYKILKTINIDTGL